MSRIQDTREEKWNVATHLIGLIIGALAGVALFILAYNPRIPYLSVSIIVYVLSLIVLYAASTAYHYAVRPTLKKRFRIFDHLSIYILIAGTYTPVCLLALPSESGIWLLFAVWGIALVGTLFKLFLTGKFDKFSAILYLAMGWLAILEADALIESLGTGALTALIIGGAFYTIGVVFYLWEKLYFHHVIWHLFVLAGSTAHFVMVAMIVW